MFSTVTRVKEMLQISSRLRSEGLMIGFVPTMGFLHDGHISLIREAKKLSDKIVVSIFVNPAQFAPGEDFNNYPRDIEKDKKILAEEGIDYLFYPTEEEIYPDNYQTFVEVGEITQKFEGASRPTHFKGVATVLSILFNIVKPHIAVFGQKDAQQVAVIRRMTSDLKFDLDIAVAPIIREPDGLAMSSRNNYLNDRERKDATVLFRSLQRAEEMILEKGERKVYNVINEMKKIVNSAESSELDYIKIVDEATFDEIEELSTGRNYFILIACKIGSTRLIDNKYIAL